MDIEISYLSQHFQLILLEYDLIEALAKPIILKYF